MRLAKLLFAPMLSVVLLGCGSRTGLLVPSLDGSLCPNVETVARRTPIDVIVIVDQSGSMQTDITRVKDNINRLSAFLETTDLDYRVVMIARAGKATYEVCVPPPLGGPSCASNPPLFRTCSTTISSTNALRQVLSTYAHKDEKLRWKEFVRPDALKAFVPITDDNSSLTAKQFDDQLLALDPEMFGTKAQRKYILYPICGADAADPTKKCGPSMVNTGPVYVELAKLTGGLVFPLCSPDFGPVFTNIGRGLATVVACELTVPDVPTFALDPLRVRVTYTASGTGVKSTIPYDASKPCDAGAQGWQYNEERTRVRLCGDTCSKLQTDYGARVTVDFDCTPPKPDAGPDSD